MVTVPDAASPETHSIATPNALRESEAGFRTLADTMPQMVWSTLPDGFHDYYNQRWYEFTGVPEGSTDGEGWNGMFHPDDQERAWARWRHSLATGEPYEIEYRLRHHSGDYRWTLGRALPIRDAKGQILRWFGTCTDIHEPSAAEQNEILRRELSHRIKNIFAVITGLIGLSVAPQSRSATFAEILRQRIWALGPRARFRPPAQRALAAARRTLADGADPRAAAALSRARRGPHRHRGRRCPDRRQRRHAAGPAVPRTGDQRRQVWRTVGPRRPRLIGIAPRRQ